MEITKVFVTAKDFGNKVKGLATINIDNEFTITGIRIIKGSNGLFIAMPSRKNYDGEYQDICYPTSIESRNYITSVILAEYENDEEKHKSKGGDSRKKTITKERR